MKHKKNNLNITVGVSPCETWSVGSEIELIKPALIYADKVKLNSIKTAMVMPIMKLNSFEKFEYMREICDELSLDTQEILYQMIEVYKHLAQKKNHLSKEETLLYFQFQQIINKLEQSFLEEAIKAGFNKLIPAINKGHLEIEFFSSKTAKTDIELENLTYEYINSLAEELKSENYLLLDVATRSLVSEGMKTGYFTVSDSAMEKARHINLVSNLMKNLPCFEYATIDEIIDIRRELSKPLVRFRSALVKCSADIKYQIWDENFGYDCEKIFIRDVQPAILEIDEACRSNKYLNRLIAKAVELPVVGGVAGATIGTFIAQSHNFADVLTNISAMTVGLGITGGAVAIKAFNEWNEKSKSIESNQMFFYYKAGNLLEKKAKKE